MIAKPATSRPTDTNAPLVVAGLFNTANGIGEAARATYRALEAAGLPPIAVDLSEPFAPVDMQTDIPCQPMPEDQQGTLILQLNGPETMSAMQHLGMEYGRSWYTIGYWAWELPNFPTGWDEAFRYLSEIWTISEFTGKALRQHPDAPEIEVFGHAVTPPKGIRAKRKQFGWTKDEYVFLTMADSMSSLQRKNPFAAISAFKTAFGNDPAYKLVVKTRNLGRHETAEEDLRIVMGEATNIEILDVSLSEADRWSLLKSADAVISLHRSEGFGLVLAEAMSLGKPVIATNWSGNMDFTTPGHALLVESGKVPCDDAYGIYRDSGSEWAEPDIEDAARQMKQLASDEALKASLSKAAKQKISDVANPITVGAAMRQRLVDIPTSNCDTDAS